MAFNTNLVENLPEVVTNNSIAGKLDGKKSVDWRLEIFKQTNNLKDEKVPFRIFASGNVAFSKLNCNLVGGFDEAFNNWGHEDIDLGFRFFNHGLYVIPVMSAWAYHQEPENYINETDRSAGHSVSKEYFAEKCPYYRHFSATPKKEKFTVPRVSIYIPAYNAEKTILDAVESVLRQTYKDIEVCICDDGSTDETLNLLEKYYKYNDKVRWTSQKNGGIGAASNTAIKLCRGIYIGQLDSDDYLAEDVVEKCYKHLENAPKMEVGESLNLKYVLKAIEKDAQIVIIYQDGEIYSVFPALIKRVAEENGYIRTQNRMNMYNKRDYTGNVAPEQETTYSIPLSMLTPLRVREN